MRDYVCKQIYQLKLSDGILRALTFSPQSFMHDAYLNPGSILGLSFIIHDNVAFFFFSFFTLSKTENFKPESKGAGWNQKM